MRALSQFVYVAALGLMPLFSISAQEVDPTTGLIEDAGWQQVQTTCTTCHSARLITQNSGSREVWLSRILWMQDTQGLQQLAPELEATILDYLAANYGPKAATRRAGLAAQLLPANPYNQ